MYAILRIFLRLSVILRKFLRIKSILRIILRIRIFVNRKILILRIVLRKNDNSKNKTNSKNTNLCEYGPWSETSWKIKKLRFCLVTNGIIFFNTFA